MPRTILLLSLLSAATAHAATLGTASSFNLFSLGNVTISTTDVEGRLAAGGNANLSSVGIGAALPADGARYDLVVQGSLTYINGQVFNGSVIHQGAFLGSGVGVPNGTLTQGAVSPVVDFAAASSYLTTASAFWGGLSPNSTVSNLGVLQLTGSDPGVNIFRITAATLGAASAIVVTAPAGSTVLVNVDGASAQFQNTGLVINGTNRERVLFNFHQASFLRIQGVSVEGSVLAPFASIEFNNAVVNGNVVAGSVNGNGESRNALFAGALPDSAVPEPSSVLLVATVLAGLLLRRRR